MKKISLIIILAICLISTSCIRNRKIDKAMRLAETLTYNGNYKAALEIYESIVVEDDNLAEAYARRGVVFSYLGNYENAESDLMTAISIDSTKSNFFAWMGSLKEEIGDTIKGIYYYEKAIEIDSNFLALNNLGMYYLASKQYSKSLRYFNSSINNNPNYSLAYNNRGSLKERMSLSEDALIDYNRAIEIDEKVDLYYYNRAVTKCELNNYTGAIDDLTKAIEINQQGVYYYYRGLVYNKMERQSDCCRDLRNAVMFGYPDAEIKIKQYCENNSI